MGDETLLKTLEVEVARIAQEFLAVRLVANVDRVALEELEQLGENLCAAVWYRGWENGGWADEAFALETWEQVLWVGEEDGETEGEIVGRVTRVVEDAAGDLKLAVAYGDEYALVV